MALDTDARLHELGIDVDEVIATLSLITQPYTVFLSGSIIEGYGNPESDLDVYVIYPEELPDVRVDYDAETNIISLEFTPTKRLDIESWTREQMLASAQRIRQCSSDITH